MTPVNNSGSDLMCLSLCTCRWLMSTAESWWTVWVRGGVRGQGRWWWRRVREALSKWKRDVIAALTKAVLVGGTDRP